MKSKIILTSILIAMTTALFGADAFFGTKATTSVMHPTTNFFIVVMGSGDNAVIRKVSPTDAITILKALPGFPGDTLGASGDTPSVVTTLGANNWNIPFAALSKSGFLGSNDWVRFDSITGRALTNFQADPASFNGPVLLASSLDASGLVTLHAGLDVFGEVNLNGSGLEMNGDLSVLGTAFLNGIVDSGTARANNVHVRAITAANRVAIFNAVSNLVDLPGVDTNELGFLDGVTSGIQPQINARQNGSGVLTNLSITGVSEGATNSSAYVGSASGSRGTNSQSYYGPPGQATNQVPFWTNELFRPHFVTADGLKIIGIRDDVPPNALMYIGDLEKYDGLEFVVRTFLDGTARFVYNFGDTYAWKLREEYLSDFNDVPVFSNKLGAASLSFGNFVGSNTLFGTTIYAKPSSGNSYFDGNLTTSASLTASNSYAANFIQTNGFNRSTMAAFGGTNVQWRMVKNIILTNVADVSAAAYYPSNGTFFTIHNNANGRITEWTLDGVNVRIINGTGTQVPDAEGITYLGGNKFAVVDEDNNRIFILGITNNASGSSWTTNDTQIIKVAASVGTDPATGSGVEGLAYDWDRLGWWIVREKSPAQLLFLSTDGQTTNNFFTTAQMQAFTNANHTDFSDLFLDRENQILFVTQDEGGTGQFDRVLGISLVTSNVIISLDVTNFGQLEGVSMTPDGKLLLAGEANQFALFEPVLGGLNSGQSWVGNSATNLPSVPMYPFGLSVGQGGAWLTNTFTQLAALDFLSTGAQADTNLTISVPGAASGDVVELGVPVGAILSGTCFTAYASNDVVYVRHNNYSTAAKDPPSATFRVTVKKYR